MIDELNNYYKSNLEYNRLIRDHYQPKYKRIYKRTQFLIVLLGLLMMISAFFIIKNEGKILYFFPPFILIVLLVITVLLSNYITSFDENRILKEIYEINTKRTMYINRHIEKIIKNLLDKYLENYNPDQLKEIRLLLSENIRENMTVAKFLTSWRLLATAFWIPVWSGYINKYLSLHNDFRHYAFLMLFSITIFICFTGLIIVFDDKVDYMINGDLYRYKKTIKYISNIIVDKMGNK